MTSPIQKQFQEIPENAKMAGKPLDFFNKSKSNLYLLPQPILSTCELLTLAA
jgi:hypothetical protein